MSKFRIHAALLGATMLCGTYWAAAADAPGNAIPAQDFARWPRIMSPRLSPDGTYLSVRMDDASGDQHALMVYRLSDMSVASMLRLPKYELPAQTVWVNPTRLVVAKAKAFGPLGQPAYTGELIATDVDGKHQDYLYGYQQVGRRAETRGNDRGWGHIESLPPVPNGHFYMSATPWGNDNVSSLYDVDAVHNTRHLIADMHESGLDFLVDPQGKATYAYGTNGDFDFVVYRRMDDGWNRVDLGNPEARLDPLGYAPDQHTIYALWSGHGEPESLVTQDEDGSHRKVIAHDDFAGIGHLEWTAYPEQPFAVASASGKPEITILDPQLFAAKLYAKLSLIFKGEFVDFINFSQDGGKLLFDVRSDRDPGTYYLLDTRTLKLGKLFPLMPWIKPERMAERRPIRFKADDGQELDGFLTIPPGRGEHALPMVLMPHGGPYYVADDWYYDPEAQFLASRGYLVLQVNFRGSSGRGDDFERAGYRQWGGRIQQDLIDGVKWAIRQKYADPKRVCVYGASFGGYSALMAPIRTPGLFKCAIGYDGVYDLSMMYDKGDTRSVSSGRNYLHMVLGDNEAELDANSPDKHADKIKIPVFLIHGKDDKRAPFAQAEAMRDALQKAGNSPQWLVKAGEGHGFYDVQNNVERLNAIQAFLEKNIGKGASTQ